MHRFTGLKTLQINPIQRLSLTYRGKKYQGVDGDTVATALYWNGVRIFSRSIKYHRPRGLYSLDGECSNTLMEIDGVPNMSAEKTILRDGMTVRPQNVLGSPEIDLMGFMDKLDWGMPAGFYYRTMHKPYRLWPLFQNLIRKAAGLGRIDPFFKMKGTYDELYLNTEVCVIGGGPAGISAALAAAESGLRVVLLEARPWLGGCFDYRASTFFSDVSLNERVRELGNKLENNPNIRVLTHASVIGFDHNNLISAFQIGHETDVFNERYIEIRAESAVVATGCIERPLIFENNERPGVMQVGCAHRLARTYGLSPGKQIVFSVGHDLGLEAAIDLHNLGLGVLCVADIRLDGQDPRLVAALAERRVPLLKGWVASKAHGAKHVRRVTLMTTTGKRNRDFECDLLVASAGLTPVLGPLMLAQAKVAYDDHTGFFLPVQLPSKVHAAGRMLGLEDVLAIEASGTVAGLSAASDCGASVSNKLREAEEKRNKRSGPKRGTKWVQAIGSGRKRFVCFDEDTTVKNIYQGCDMGFDAAELSKRFTAAGTGAGQGGIPGHNLPLLISEYCGENGAIPDPTTVRSPLVPTLIATYAGNNHDLFKRTPVYDWQVKSGAVIRRVGTWKRPRYFSSDWSCREEILNVRRNVGLFDGSTLGKYRIFGPNALKALQRVYVGDMADTSVGKLKYSAMCNDDGCLLDDGVVTKLDENDYYFTTSTGRGGSTAEWIRYHTRYDGWDFNIVNLTDALGVINLAGPNARKVLGKLTSADISNDAFPFMGCLEFHIEDVIPVRAMRLGFVGELSYEMHMPASYMPTVWNMLLEAGEAFDIRPFGLEAQNVLRLEKGHLIIGQESEIRTTLHDLGLGFLWARAKTDTRMVGTAALMQTEQQTDRLKLVGFKMENSSAPPKDGSLIVDKTIRGHVCTARYSFTLKASIGLALLESPLAEEGTRLEIFEDGAGDRRLYAKVVPTPFYDPEGKNLRI